MAKRVLPAKAGSHAAGSHAAGSHARGSHAAGSHEPEPGEQVSELLPERPTLSSVRAIAAECKACDLYKRGTQTVFGEGPRKARVMLVGEQPGDAEDVAGYPFVGPAGKLLDTALEQAGIDRRQVYVTNVVKHFKWEPPRCDRGAGLAGQVLQGVEAARRYRRVDAGPDRHRDRSSVLYPACARRRGAP